MISHMTDDTLKFVTRKTQGMRGFFALSRDDLTKRTIRFLLDEGWTRKGGSCTFEKGDSILTVDTVPTREHFNRHYQGSVFNIAFTDTASDVVFPLLSRQRIAPYEGVYIVFDNFASHIAQPSQIMFNG